MHDLLTWLSPATRTRIGIGAGVLTSILIIDTQWYYLGFARPPRHGRTTRTIPQEKEPREQPASHRRRRSGMKLTCRLRGHDWRAAGASTIVEPIDLDDIRYEVLDVCERCGEAALHRLSREDGGPFFRRTL